MKHAALLSVAMASCALAQPSRDADLPIVRVTHDDFVIDRSCRVEIPAGLVIADEGRDGVIHIGADGITLVFTEGSVLRGAEPATPFEQMTGTGIWLDGREEVLIRNARVAGYRIGIRAKDAGGLIIEGADVSDGFAMKLGSTPLAEASSDWLWPHDNDQGQWETRYGAGILIEDSAGVTVRDSRARRRQNGLMLDRVTDSRVYDNDFSFLSGWGLAMWRSSGNLVSRNAFDFCIRGYSHGVYNRGQDSAGILAFEQCNDNQFIENSATHAGDGFFGFGGKEALGDRPDLPQDFDPTRLGNNDNLFLGNDLSHAAAHGLELTFSFGNQIWNNRFTENAICGIWGGYSQSTLIAGNRFVRNGDAGYGLERGGINIEHGANNTIRNNSFIENAVAIHLWTDPDEPIRALPWARANYKGGTNTLITENRFERDRVAVHLRAVEHTTMLANEMVDVAEPLRNEQGAQVVHREGLLTSSAFPTAEPVGDTRPVGARSDYADRRFIIMGDYFPWDFSGTLVRPRSLSGSTHVYEVFSAQELGPSALVSTGSVTTEVRVPDPDAPLYEPATITVAATPGVHAYDLKLSLPGGAVHDLSGTIIAAMWEITAFPWTIDPREDEAGWRAESTGPNASRIRLPELRLAFGSRGPGAVGFARDLPADRFGTIARTTLRLEPGRWRFRTLSDDGVRVSVDGTPVIDNWTWHAPTRDEGLFELDRAREVEVLVEHFELDGYAVLELEIEQHRD